jgi:hypothetical protein
VSRRSSSKTPAFLLDVERELERCPELPRAVAGLEFTLTTLAEMGMAVAGTTFLSWPIHPAQGVSFKVIYEFDESRVVLLALYPAVAPP